jgi:NADPH2:quinone reductase
MHAIRQHELGGPGVLRHEEEPDLDPDEGQVRVAVGATFALPDAAGAHRALEARRTHGKVVLVPDALW